ncbi:MAG: aldehyde dehydrogenase family protein [Candidatus Pelagibacterales bacterium]|jgi:aldehyde dehydrogenase (NAD+)|tara:strand:- start:4071 stop:5504 length:1434 start_codon:yes stop_codon:yes gene_type:complete
MEKCKNYINGQWIESSSGDVIEVNDPATGKIIGEVSCASQTEVDLAVDAALQAHQSRVLIDMLPMERARLMRSIAAELRKVANEGGELLCRENGKALPNAIFEFVDAANYFDYYSGLTDKLEGNTIPVNNSVIDYTLLEPYGVSAHIVPWNFPMSMLARSLACAFAAGNSTVIKTAELTPLATASHFTKAISNAGVPAGLINVICGYGHEAGSMLTAHKDVSQITFTGSVLTGKKILHAAAERAIPAVVELGGKSAAIVFPDADLDKVVAAAKGGIFGQAGQICSAMARVVVHKSVKDELVEKLAEMASGLKVGAGNVDGVELTPLISEQQLQKVENFSRSGQQAGAEAVAGGKRIDRDGYFFEATVFDNVKPDMTIAQEEIFGPVLSVLTYEDKDEAIHIANDTAFGLAAGVFTKDINQATETVNQMQAGQVYVNSWFTGSVATPFGGYKQSGYSREKGQEAIKSYLQVKNVGIQL